MLSLGYTIHFQFLYAISVDRINYFSDSEAGLMFYRFIRDLQVLSNEVAEVKRLVICDLWKLDYDYIFQEELNTVTVV